jgi:alpha-glucoside transport system permease protein
MVQFGTWLHETNGWSFSTFDTQERFAKIGFAIRSIFIAVGISFLYFWLSNWLNHGLARVSSAGSAGREAYIIEAIQPWIFVGPALVLLLLFLFVPAFSTLSLSFQEADGTRTVRNYAFLWDSSALGYVQFRYAMRNSILWLVLVPTVCISLGLLIAVLADSVRWGIVAKTLIFVPMAISFVGAAVIWRNIFAGGGIQPQEAINGLTPSYQIGLLKALLGHTAAYNEPLYSLKFWGNFFLMWILVWVQTGFAMVIFSAALRGVPEDTIEAAKIDGANPFQMFFRIKLPQIYSTVVVVWTTLVILVLKMFDIPYALSANDDDKLLLATMMENARNNWSVGGDNVENLFAAIAVMLMVTVIPNMIYNARRIRREQKELGH